MGGSSKNTINGIITDSVTHKPISGATVTTNTGLTTTTNDSGFYVFGIDPGNYALTVTAPEYNSQIANVSVSQDIIKNFSLDFIITTYFSDDFNGTSLDTTKWKIGYTQTSPVIKSGYIELAGTGSSGDGASINSTPGGSWKLNGDLVSSEFRLRYKTAPANTGSEFGFNFCESGHTNPAYWQFQYNSGSTTGDNLGIIAYRNAIYNTYRSLDTIGTDLTKFHTYKIISDTNGARFLIDGVEKIRLSGLSSPDFNLPVGLHCQGTQDIYVDWVKVTDAEICTMDGNVDGIVTDSDGTPMSGAVVNTDTGLTTTTDSNGYYLLTVPAGVYTLTVTSPDQSTRSANVSVNAYEEVIKNLTFLVPTQQMSTPDGFIRKGWNLISLPAAPGNGSPASILNGIDLNNASLQMWDNASQTGGGYKTYGINWFGPMVVGDAYWFIESSTKILSYSAVPNDVSDKLIQIPAHDKAPYWIMVGHPFDQKITCDNIKFTVDGVTKNWADAVTAGWIEAVAQGWEANGQNYFNVGLSTNPAVAKSYFESWYGYWMLVKTTEAITIDVPTTPIVQ